MQLVCCVSTNAFAVLFRLTQGPWAGHWEYDLCHAQDGQGGGVNEP
jgi:hypothetical protein